jgi:ankyrin repeat protein
MACGPNIVHAMTGANVRAKDVRGKTPLHIAAKYGRVDISALLLDRGITLQPR